MVQPFQAVDGTTINQQADYDYLHDPTHPKPFWLNPYFRYGTSNEVDFARTYSNGTGQQLFQVQTGLEAPGLGCGQALQPEAGGGLTVPQCWLVVVPRGSAAQENPAGLDDENVVTSPLAPQAWANRIAIPIGFNPVGSSCSINADAQQIMGSELASAAVASWQPALCGQPGSPSYSYIQNSDDQARQNLLHPTYGSAGMSVFSAPADPTQVDPSNPVVYSPLTLSGVVVAFNIQRVPADVGGQPQPRRGGARRGPGRTHLPDPAADGQAPHPVVPGPARERDRADPAPGLRVGAEEPDRPPDRPRLPAVQPRVLPVRRPPRPPTPARHWSNRPARTRPRRYGSGSWPTRRQPPGSPATRTRGACR